MKKIAFLLVAIFIGFFGIAQNNNWVVDPAHSRISFNVTHLLITEVTGQFQDFKAEIKSDRKDFTDAKINFVIKTTSINTDDVKRDKHLRSDEFFDAEKYPTIEFKGRRLRLMSDEKFNKSYKLIGDLTIHGVTREVVLNVKHAGTVKDLEGKTRAGFKITGIIDRYDYGLRWNIATETDSWAVSREVEIVCNIELYLGG